MSYTMKDMESIGATPSLLDKGKIKVFFKSLLQESVECKTIRSLDNILHRLSRRFHIMPSKQQLRYVYENDFQDTIPIKSMNPFLQYYMIQKSMRSQSGVLVSTIVLKPGKFSCPEKCSYCPTETDLQGNPTQPKSYLSSEPAMLRALQYEFDVCGQFHDRIRCYLKTGNMMWTSTSCFKFEMILSGGTWEAYPYEYRNQVMNEMYWAANIFSPDSYRKDSPVKTIRPMESLEEEIQRNETARIRIIGLTIETRPDYITKTSIRDYRRWGVTRVQLGVQHYDDTVLELLNRGCTTKDTIRAIRLLKQTGFKVVCHLMPDLPGSNPELDRWMLMESITNPDLQFDDVKIYPTAICQSNDPNLIITSDIATWYKEGSYQPYSERNLQELIDVLMEYKTSIQPWVRIQRLVRDIPSVSIEAGYQKYSNLRQMIQDQMKEKGWTCQCIRCMEIDDSLHDSVTTNDPIQIPLLVVRPYEASDGLEYFISYEMYPESVTSTWEFRKTVLLKNLPFYSLFQQKYHAWSGSSSRTSIIGFCRLRIDQNAGSSIIPELKGHGLIRELHVYGSSLSICNSEKKTQHTGYGKRLMQVAEEIIASHGMNSSAVIAGVGTREYYKNKCGYELKGTYMVKQLQRYISTSEYIFIIIHFILFYKLFLILYKILY
jgi:ELP3 family radical SAM enzyme/protein acetyltransferase